MGAGCGTITQGQKSVAIGYLSGYNNQGLETVSIGNNTGYNNQGAYSICIGSNAGSTASATNSIILNGSGNNLPSANAGFYVKPIRSVTNDWEGSSLYYNTTTGEIMSNLKIPLIITNPAGNYQLTTNNANINIFINNTTNVTNILLPALSSIANNKKVVFTFIIQGITSNVKIISLDNNIVGNAHDGGPNYSRLDQTIITGSAGLNIGDTISVSNFPSGSAKSWFISSGGTTMNVSGWY